MNRNQRNYDCPRAAVTAPDGLLLIDKPAGLTSHDVVSRVRRLAATKKVGHCGTLDPMATGLLIIGIGRATKLMNYLLGHDKSYVATVCLGVGTQSDDADSDITAIPGSSDVSIADLKTAAADLTGKIMQVPTSVSAIKIAGVRAYELVRAGSEVKLPARPVTVHELEVSNLCSEQMLTPGGQIVPVQTFSLAVNCSAGTYVRALARDLGSALGTAAHLTSLRRTSVGDFSVSQAHGLPELADLVQDDLNCKNGTSALPILSLDEACAQIFPVVNSSRARDARFGKRLPPAGREGVYALAEENGHVVALAEDRGNYAQPVLVLDITPPAPNNQSGDGDGTRSRGEKCSS